MPWQNNGGGGPWGGGGGSGGGNNNPWGSGGGGGGRGGGRPPNIDDLIRKGQEQFKNVLPRGTGGGNFWKWAVGGLALLWIGSSSFYTVRPDEKGVVLRFGQYVRTDPPGFAFKLPSPIETKQLVRVEQINVEEVGGTSPDAPENLVLTGDRNLVDVAYIIQWKVKSDDREVRNFLFSLADPETTIREVAESAMREVMSTTKMNTAFTQRARLATQVEERMQQVLDSYSAGIEITAVNIRQVDPPRLVDSAFKAVTAAQQDAIRFVNEANAYRQQIVARAQGEAQAFDAVYQQYKLAPEVTRRRIYLETMENVLRGMNKVVVDTKNATPILPLQNLQAGPATTAAVANAAQN